MATLILRHNRYSAKVRIPKEMQLLYDGKEFLQKTLGTSDRKLARVEAGAWEATLRLEWSGLANTADPTTGSLRAIYARVREEAAFASRPVMAGGARCGQIIGPRVASIQRRRAGEESRGRRWPGVLTAEASAGLQ